MPLHRVRPLAARAADRVRDGHRPVRFLLRHDRSRPMTSLSDRMSRYLRADVQGMHGYAVQPSAGLVKVDTMENPFTLPPDLRRALGERLAEVALNRYPAERLDVLRDELARHANMPDGCDIMLGNGSDEL